ncbi:MAG TPA: sulfur carrier protein ThiS [Candidatus Eremiobacteraceae bacterium]|nr:sulfur carrier protein ThiS [Candidatus Eremiobacteraceae bacterium]
MADAMVIQVNGETREAAPGSTVTSLLAQLGLHAGRVAVEYNLKILPKAQWDSTHVAAGDRLEIVQLVGGG